MLTVDLKASTSQVLGGDAVSEQGSFSVVTANASATKASQINLVGLGDDFNTFFDTASAGLASGAVLGDLNFSAQTSLSGNQAKTSSKIRAVATESYTTSNNLGSELQFFTTQNSTNTPAQRMTISNTGNVGIGQTTPLAKLDIQQSTAGSAAVLAESGGTNFLKVLNPANGIDDGYSGAASVLYVGADTGSGRSINAAGTVSTGGADFAEWVDWAEEKKPEMGSIVLYKGGYVVVSSPFTAAFVGNDTKDPKHSILVAFAGQLPVLVRGIVHEGDLIVANGDGTGSAISRDLVSLAMAKNAVGTAWASSNDAGLKRVNVAVGIGLGGNGARDIASVNAKTNRLEAENAQLKQENAAIKARLDKIEKALNSK